MRQCTMDNGVYVYLLLFITMTDDYLYVTWFSLNKQCGNSLTSLFDADIPPWLFVICSVFATFRHQHFFTNACLLFCVFLPFLWL